MQQGDYFNRLPRMERQFLLFVDSLSGVPAREEEMLDKINEALLLVCPGVNIGKVEVILDTPANVVYPNGYSGRKLLYSNGVVDVFKPLVLEFETEEKGRVVFEFYWKGEDRASEEQTFWGNMIAQMLFIFLGRARISTMLRQSMGIDQSTGLPNQSEYINKILELISRGRIQDYGAAYFNIRNFKYINKLVNYQEGDLVMKQYASKVSQLLYAGEFLARLGGDNFVVLIRKERMESFLDKLDKISVDVATHSGVRNIALPVRAGVYLIDRGVHQPGEIMTPISVAFQISRIPGRGPRVYYTQEMSQEVFHEKKVALNFGRALEEGQFHAYYQPKIDLYNGRLCGAEALARWEEKGKVIMPDDFVPMLEKDGGICRLDFEMLRQTCEMIAGWISKGLTPLVISVNMSRWHLKDETFVDDVCEVLDRYKVEPKWIEIEVTETGDFDEYELLVKTLEDFRSRGFSTSIDDFGTGYSSLTLLHRLDVDVIKLDQDFLWEQSEKGRILIRNLIRTAGELGIKVLAEGVETVEHRDFLIESGCDMAQGFLYAMPLRREEFERRAFS